MSEAIYGKRICEGSVCEILLVYSGETRSRSIVDAFAGKVCRVIRDKGQELVCEILTSVDGQIVREYDEVYFDRARLKWIAGRWI